MQLSLEEAFPPCIQSLKKRESSLNGTGRYVLITFLLNTGASIDEVIFLFKGLNFDEEVIRYQVEHAAKDQYMCPDCTVLLKEGLCVNKDELCSDIKHPSTYYRIKLARKNLEL